MAKEKQHTPISVNKKLKYEEQYDHYTVQLVHRRRFPWWILLLLLPLLLFIKCHKDIEVRCMEADTDFPIEYQAVTMEYQAHFLWDNGRFLANDTIKLTQNTDSTGTTVFKDLPCSVYSYIFYCLSQALFTAESDCYATMNEHHNFHYTRHVDLKMPPKREDLHLKIQDLETNVPLADALVEYKYVERGQQRTDSVRSNANGEAVVEGFLSCGVFDLIKVSCYGYVDTLATNRAASVISEYVDSATFRLRPIKQSFTYFVKNKESHQPIPGAKCIVTLTDSKANTTRGTSITNVDGVGKGVYNDAFILAHLDIEASKQHYKTGKLEGNYTVEQFAALPDSLRVIYLEPEQYVQEFQNVDSITNKPIAGVSNTIIVTDFDGKSDTCIEMSNTYGFFPVKAKEGYKIDIISKHEPDYITKETHIAKYDSVEIIKMMPDILSMTFRTIDHETGDLVPNCDLRITTSRSGVSLPVNSGTGEFVVSGLYRGESISIISSKTDYITNNTKIKNKNVNYLFNAQQSERDIPMTLYLLPCDEKVNNKQEDDVAAGTVSLPRSYNMGVNQGTFDIEYETGSICPDCIDIYNHKPNENYLSGQKIWSSGMVTTDGIKKGTVTFNNGSVITVIVTTGPENGSVWSYNITCPY